jgi:hypothetical protein
MIKAVRAIVHENLDAEKAYAMFKDLAASK